MKEPQTTVRTSPTTGIRPTIGSIPNRSWVPGMLITSSKMCARISACISFPRTGSIPRLYRTSMVAVLAKTASNVGAFILTPAQRVEVLAKTTSVAISVGGTLRPRRRGTLTMSCRTVMAVPTPLTTISPLTRCAITTGGITQQKSFNGCSKSACGPVGRWNVDPHLERNWQIRLTIMRYQLEA